MIRGMQKQARCCASDASQPRHQPSALHPPVAWHCPPGSAPLLLCHQQADTSKLPAYWSLWPPVAPTWASALASACQGGSKFTTWAQGGWGWER